MPASSPDPFRFDFLVLGSGIAGLFYALQVAEHGRVAIVTKKRAAESATNYAQGGIAAVVAPDDSFESHIQDTLEAGAGLCREEAVRQVVEGGPATIEAYSVMFDREGQPETSYASCLLADGRRAWGKSTDDAVGTALSQNEWVGHPAELREDSTLNI